MPCWRRLPVIPQWLGGLSAGIRSASFGKHGLVFYFDDMRQTITIKEIIWAK